MSTGSLTGAPPTPYGVSGDATNMGASSAKNETRLQRSVNHARSALGVIGEIQGELMEMTGHLVGLPPSEPSDESEASVPPGNSMDELLNLTRSLQFEATNLREALRYLRGELI